MSFQSGVSAEESAPSTTFMHVGPQRPLAYLANTRESAPATPPVPPQAMSSERRVSVCTVQHGHMGQRWGRSSPDIPLISHALTSGWRADALGTVPAAPHPERYP